MLFCLSLCFDQKGVNFPCVITAWSIFVWCVSVHIIAVYYCLCVQMNVSMCMFTSLLVSKSSCLGMNEGYSGVFMCMHTSMIELPTCPHNFLYLVSCHTAVLDFLSSVDQTVSYKMSGISSGIICPSVWIISTGPPLTFKSPPFPKSSYFILD